MNANILPPNHNLLHHGLKILLVDYDIESLRYMKLVLEEQLHRVTEAHSTITGLAKVYDLQNHFDLAIIDMHMPERDALRDLKQALGNIFVPIILISEDGNMVQKAKEEGAIAFFMKPLQYHSLINIWEFAPKKFFDENQPIISENQPKQSTQLFDFANKGKSIKHIDQFPVASPTNLVNNQQIYHHIDNNGKRPKISHVNEQLPHVNEQLPLPGGLGFDNNNNMRKLSYEERGRIRLAREKAQAKANSSGSGSNKKSQEKRNYDKFNNLPSSQGINNQSQTQMQKQNMVGSSNSTYLRGPTQLQASQISRSTFTGNTMLAPQTNASTMKPPLPVQQSSNSGAFCLDKSGNIIGWDNINNNTGPLTQPPLPARWVSPPLQAEQLQLMSGGDANTYNMSFAQDYQQSFPGFQTEQFRAREDTNNLFFGQISSSTTSLFDHGGMHMSGNGVGDMHGGGQSNYFEEDWVTQWFRSIPQTDDDFDNFLQNLQY